MDQSLYWEANNSSASQEMSRTLKNLQVHYRIHMSRNLSLSWAI
jgi:hypothetical protein